MICTIPVVNAGAVVLLLSLATGCLAWFIQYTLKPGEIFGRYGLWLNAMWMRNWRKKDRWKRKLLPPLGLCPYCNSVWLSLPFYALSAHALGMGLEALWLWPLFVGVQYVWVKLLGRLVDE